MPMLIRWRNGAGVEAEDIFTRIADDEAISAPHVLVSLARLRAEGGAPWRTRSVGALVTAGELVESLAPFLGRLALVALDFPKFRDGRAYSAAAILRSRMAFAGEVRAVGGVLREQAGFMVRVGFDAFVPADGSTAAEWTRAARRYRHHYQRATDGRPAAFEERRGISSPRLAA